MDEDSSRFVAVLKFLTGFVGINIAHGGRDKTTRLHAEIPSCHGADSIPSHEHGLMYSTGASAFRFFRLHAAWRQHCILVLYTVFYFSTTITSSTFPPYLPKLRIDIPTYLLEHLFQVSSCRHFPCLPSQSLLIRVRRCFVGFPSSRPVRMGIVSTWQSPYPV